MNLNDSNQNDNLNNDYLDNHNFNETLRLHFINVGQADSILIQQSDKYALIDAGKPMKKSPAITTVEDYLSSENVKKLEFMVLTHQDYDHIASAEKILRKHKVDMLYDNGITHTSQTYENLMQYVLDNDVNYTVVSAGDLLESDFEGVRFEVLHPQKKLIKDGKKVDINQNSVVLKLTYGKTTTLFMGDAEETAEKAILKTDANVDSDVLKVGHHGSAAGSSEKFLSEVSPEYCIVSVGEGNSYGHPVVSTVDRLFATGATVKYTSGGTVILESDGSKWELVR